MTSSYASYRIGRGRLGSTLGSGTLPEEYAVRTTTPHASGKAAKVPGSCSAAQSVSPGQTSRPAPAVEAVTTRARLLIADDHVVVRQGIAKLLADAGSFDIVGEASDGQEAVEKTRALRPDVVLMDLYMPRLTGLEATRTIKLEMPETVVVLLTMSDSEDSVFAAVAAGASGYVLKTTDQTELLHQIKQAATGEVALSPRITTRLAESISRRAAGSPSRDHLGIELLTAREREVVALVGQGARNKEIATALCISVNTARAHVGNTMQKLGLDSRAQLAVYAVRNQIV